MSDEKAGTLHVDFPGKIVIVGFGSIGQGVLPLILRHIGVDRKNICILTGDERGREIAEKEGIEFRVQPLKPENYYETLEEVLPRGGFLVNLSVGVSSVSLIKFCRDRQALYLDTSIEPWSGGYTDTRLTFSQRSNYGLRETALAVKEERSDGPTAIIAHGANPGIISHFLKRAILQIAADTGTSTNTPENHEAWAKLASDLHIKTIHVSEYDSQVSNVPKKIGRFENTWSVYGFHAEGITQPSELGWGTHEKHWPKDAEKHDFGSGAAIYLKRPGAQTLVRTWTPARGSFLGRLVTHNESISIANFLTVKRRNKAIYRPTVHYAYRPSDAAMLSLEESLGKNLELQEDQKILVDDIVSGMDELGILIMGHPKGTYWYGSQLTIEQTRALVPYQNATGLQVTAGILGAMIWAMENPDKGIVEADDMDFERVMEIIEPYMGRMYGEYTDWTPLVGRESLFPEDIDPSDPWQFKNFRVS